MRIFPEQIQLTFVTAGKGETANDGWVHRKTCPCFIIAQAVEGQYEISISGNKSVCLQQGEAFLSPPGVPLEITHHCSRKTGRFRMRWVHFNFCVHNAVELGTLYRLPPMVKQPWADRICEISEKISAIQDLSQQSEGLTLPNAAKMAELSFSVLSCLLEYLEGCGFTPRFDPSVERLLPALEYATNHLDQSMQVSELAKAVNLSPPRFHVEFKRLFRQSPMSYLRGMRLRKAGDMLRSTDLPLKEIAAETGFCNQFHFSREFLRYYGETPSNYRKKGTSDSISY